MTKLELRFVTTEVQQRDVASLAPLSMRSLPLEILPLVGELNRLLARLNAAIDELRRSGELRRIADLYACRC